MSPPTSASRVGTGVGGLRVRGAGRPGQDDRAVEAGGARAAAVGVEPVADDDRGPGAEAVERWVGERKDEVERIRASIHEIAGSGLTLSKLSVAASLLGDLARQ